MLHELEKLHPAVICKAIWDAKLADPSTWRPHPDIPEVPEAIQIKLPVDEGEEWDEEDKHVSETSLKADVFKEAGKTLLPSRIGNLQPPPSASSAPLLSPTSLAAPPPAEAPRAVATPQNSSSPEGLQAGGAVLDAVAAADNGGKTDVQEPQLSAQEAALRDREAAKIAAIRKKMQEQDARKAQREEASEAKRRQAEADRDAKKLAAEERKNTVEGKAEKWSLGIAKEITLSQAELKAAKSSKTKDSKTNALIKLVEEQAKTLETMNQKLMKAGTDKVKEDLIRQAPDALNEFKKQCRMLTPTAK